MSVCVFWESPGTSDSLPSLPRILVLNVCQGQEDKCKLKDPVSPLRFLPIFFSVTQFSRNSDGDFKNSPGL